MFDVDGDGTVDIQEFRTMMGALGSSLNSDDLKARVNPIYIYCVIGITDWNFLFFFAKNAVWRSGCRSRRSTQSARINALHYYRRCVFLSQKREKDSSINDQKKEARCHFNSWNVQCAMHLCLHLVTTLQSFISQDVFIMTLLPSNAIARVPPFLFPFSRKHNTTQHNTTCHSRVCWLIVFFLDTLQCC